MDKLLEDLKNIEFTIGPNFSYNLDREIELFSSKLDSNHIALLEEDFSKFFDKGKFLLMNTFHGGLLFLKVSEPIEKLTLEYRTASKDLLTSVNFSSSSRRAENVKYKPNCGTHESIRWSNHIMFPNFSHYPKTIQIGLLIVLGKIIKRLCEYGRSHFAYMKIENEFDIELLIDDKTESTLRVEL